MSRIYREAAVCAPSQQAGSYIYAIVPTLDTGLAAISSADELFLLDRQNLAASPVLRFSQIPQGVSCLVPGEEDGNTLVCSGSDGVVATFDVRTQKRVAHFKIDRTVTALACQSDDVAVGTELAHYQAIVSLWDRRQGKQLWQNMENNDDITALDFHRSKQDLLLSGGDDGMVSIFDTKISEEDDSLLQGFNHGPIHKAGYMGNDRVFALSSDQNLAIHPISSPDDSEDPQPTLLGDLRSTAPCEYVIDIFRSGGGYAIAAGSNINNPRVDILQIQDATNLHQSPSIVTSSRYTLLGAHGEEVVRSIYADDASGAIFTCGEDGYIKAFTESTVTAPGSTKTSKVKKGSDVRYKPY